MQQPQPSLTELVDLANRAHHDLASAAEDLAQQLRAANARILELGSRILELEEQLAADTPQVPDEMETMLDLVCTLRDDAAALMRWGLDAGADRIYLSLEDMDLNDKLHELSAVQAPPRPLAYRPMTAAERAAVRQACLALVPAGAPTNQSLAQVPAPQPTPPRMNPRDAAMEGFV